VTEALRAALWHFYHPVAVSASGKIRALLSPTPENLTDRLNAPVQGTGADGLKLALALLWERRGLVG
jgi:hypothetical protein